MGRKNSRVRRSNDRGRYARQAAEAVGVKRDPTSRIDIEHMVTPSGKCYFRNRHGKDIFPTEEIAAKALKQAQTQRRRTGSGHVEERFYPCPEGGCRGFHLTSRTTYEDRRR